MKHNKHDHTSHHQMMARDFKRRFWMSAPVALAVLVLAPSIQAWLGFSLPGFPGQSLLLFALASIIALYGAWPFYKRALNDELRSGNWGMMTLVSLAVLSGYLYSAATTFFIEAPPFYWEISTLVLVLLLGHWLEMRAVIGASGALQELAKLIPPSANLITKEGQIKSVSTDQLQKGDKLLVRPGEKVPIDGKILKGSSSVNEAMITGESKPVVKKAGDEVIGGTLNGDGSLTVRVSKTGEETALSQIMELVRKTQASKPATQKLADKAAHWLTLAAIVVGILTFITWNLIFAQGFLFALTLTITVIVIACPHALGLAIPTVTTITTSKAAQNGILIKNMEGLERAQEIDTVVFDKTGTLTSGKFKVDTIKALENFTEKEVLKIAASLDQHSEHTIARGIVKKAKKEGIMPEKSENYKALPGKGARGTINEQTAYVGNRALLDDLNMSLSKEAEKAVRKFSDRGKSTVFVVTENKLIGIIALSDAIRNESRQAISDLHKKGLKVSMLTGDSHNVAQTVADELSIDTFFAEILPEDKVNKIKQLQKQGDTVMMVGDGINDAPALIQAEVGIAIGAGTDVAMESAEIVLVKNNPLDIVKLLQLSRGTMRKMSQNLWWAAGYNIVAIPIAAGVLAPWNIFLRPEWGALLMSASSVIVVLNALLLKKISLGAK